MAQILVKALSLAYLAPSSNSPCRTLSHVTHSVYVGFASVVTSVIFCRTFHLSSFPASSTWDWTLFKKKKKHSDELQSLVVVLRLRVRQKKKWYNWSSVYEGHSHLLPFSHFPLQARPKITHYSTGWFRFCITFYSVADHRSRSNPISTAFRTLKVRTRSY